MTAFRRGVWLVIPTSSTLNPMPTKAIVKILSDRELYTQLSKNALKSAIEFSWDKNVIKFIDIFRSIKM